MTDRDKKTELIKALSNKDEKKAVTILGKILSEAEKSDEKSLNMSKNLDEAAKQILSSGNQEIFSQFQQDRRLNHLQNLKEIHALVSRRVVLELTQAEIRRENRLVGNTIDTGSPFLNAILRAFLYKLAEDAAMTSFEGLLGLFIHDGLTIIFPPLKPVSVAWKLVIPWITQVGINAYRDLQQETAVKTIYEIRAEKYGKANARNLEPQTLTDFPIYLPERYEILTKELFSPY